MRRPASTRFSRDLAKGYGFKKPSHYATPRYQTLMSQTGKKGRDVFRTSKTYQISKAVRGKPDAGETASQYKKRVGVKRYQISRSDPYNERPQSKSYKGHDSYTSEILRHKNRSMPMHEKHTKGSIAKNPAVVRSAIRRQQISLRGVGALDESPEKRRSGRIKYNQKRRDMFDPIRHAKEGRQSRMRMAKKMEHNIPLQARKRYYQKKGGKNPFRGKPTLKYKLFRGGGGAGPGALRVKNPEDLYK